MNDQLLSDILKHNTKVTRILNKLCEKHPGLTQEIDLALYSCLKIQKIIKKHHQQHKGINSNAQSHKIISKNLNTESVNSANDQDQLFTNALTVIQGFKTATRKLQNKVSILLRQQKLSQKVQRAKQNNNLTPSPYLYSHNPQSRDNTTKGKRKPINTYENTSPFSPHIIENQSSKRKPKYEKSYGKVDFSEQKHRRRIKDYMEDSESFEEINEGHRSKNISELDLEIIELASKIKHLMKES